MKLIQIEKTRNPDDSYFDETVPVAFFDMQYSHEQCVKLPNWRAGKYVTIKLITSSGKLLLVVVGGDYLWVVVPCCLTGWIISI